MKFVAKTIQLQVRKLFVRFADNTTHRLVRENHQYASPKVSKLEAYNKINDFHQNNATKKPTRKHLVLDNIFWRKKIPVHLRILYRVTFIDACR